MAGARGELSRRLTERIIDASGDSDVVVALGGGSDSASLLAAVVDALPRGRIRAVFVHHSLVGSDVLAKAARDVADQLGVPITVLRAPVADGPNLEARARQRRYEAIEADVADGAVVLTGHTGDDQAETVIMRLATGSGARGLRGIPSARGLWRRPFLDITRTELADFAAERGLTEAEDPANADPRFTRTRIRHSVLPVLDDQLPGDARRGLARSARLLAADDEILTELAVAIPVRGDRTSAWIASAPLVTQPGPVAARAAQRALRLVHDGQPGSETDVSAIVRSARSGETLALTGGFTVVNEGSGVRIERTAPAAIEPQTLRSSSSMTWGSDRYLVRREDRSPPVLEAGRFTLLDADAVSESMVLRGFEPGDRLDIGVGSSPVSELLRTHGVPPSRRPVSPLIADGGKIAAVVGVRTAAWARPRSGRPVIVIEREVGT